MTDITPLRLTGVESLNSDDLLKNLVQNEDGSMSGKIKHNH